MTNAAPLPSHRSLPHRTPHLLLLLPLFATGCSAAEELFTIFALTIAAGVLLVGIGFAIGVEFCCRTYAHWESVIGNEHRRDLLRLTDASTHIANNAEAAIRACRTALHNLRRTAIDIR